jgi:hypothetical protein
MTPMRSIQVIGAALLVAAVPGRAIAQTRTVTGTVRELVTGRPVSNAEVRVVGQEAGVCTNALGEYRLQAPVGTASRVAAWYHGVLGGLRSLGATDSTADFDFTQRQEPARPDEPVIYIDGIRVSDAGFEVEAPHEILVVNGLELTPVADRCRVTPPGRRGGDS